MAAHGPPGAGTTMKNPPPAALRRRIHDMYIRYNPGKLPMINDMLTQAQGHEQDVLDALIAMYGPEPTPPMYASDNDAGFDVSMQQLAAAGSGGVGYSPHAVSGGGVPSAQQSMLGLGGLHLPPTQMQMQQGASPVALPLAGGPSPHDGPVSPVMTVGASASRFSNAGVPPGARSPVMVRLSSTQHHPSGGGAPGGSGKKLTMEDRSGSHVASPGLTHAPGGWDAAGGGRGVVGDSSRPSPSRVPSARSFAAPSSRCGSPSAAAGRRARAGGGRAAFSTIHELRDRSVYALEKATLRGLLRRYHDMWRAYCRVAVVLRESEEKEAAAAMAAAATAAAAHPAPASGASPTSSRHGSGPAAPSPRLHLHAHPALLADAGALTVTHRPGGGAWADSPGATAASITMTHPPLADLVYDQKQAMNVMVSPVYDYDPYTMTGGVTLTHGTPHGGYAGHTAAYPPPHGGGYPPRLSHAAKQEIIGELLTRLRRHRGRTVRD